MSTMVRILCTLAALLATVGFRLPAQNVVQSVVQDVAPSAAHGAAHGDSLRSELVVVLHGMGRTSRSMAPLKDALRAEGFDVLNIGYSSYCCTIAELGAAVRGEIRAHRKPHHSRVHFVGHSLGGIVARWILAQEDTILGASRLVMLTPPNQGSNSADRYAPVVSWLLEPIDELRTDSSSTVRQLPQPTGIEVGVIAARNDIVLSVEQTHLEGEREHVVVDGSHTFIMRSEEVHRLTIAFLRSGRFGIDSIHAP
jgi:pimeloyl-ACP methyl ester carboxylesterase